MSSTIGKIGGIPSQPHWLETKVDKPKNPFSSFANITLAQQQPASNLNLLMNQIGSEPEVSTRGRPKKQMNFQSHEEMVRYIENFRQNYKTELCRNWEETGWCEFDQECAYAHGHQEQNKKPYASHKNYKTKLCKKWHVTTPGKCSYKDKCQFIHDEGSA